VDPKSDRQWIATFVAVALAFLAPPPGTSEPDRLPDYALVEEIPSDAPILRNAADILYGMALGRRGALDRAVEVSVKCLQREKTIHGTKEIPTVASFLSRVYLMQGRLNDTAQLCREYLDPLLESGQRFNYTAGSMQIDLGEVLYEWNCLEDAEQHIRAGLRTNESWRNIMTDGFGLVVLARLLQANGDYTGTRRVVQEFERRMREHSQPREFDEDVRTLRVRVQLASGDLQSSARWADQIPFGEDYGLYGEYYRLTLARIRLAQGRYAEVGELLAGTSPPPGAGSQISKQLESDLLLAAAYAGQRRLPEALELLESCLELAEPEGYIRVFLDVGEPARELLASYLRSAASVHKKYAQQIMDAFPPLSQVHPPIPQPAELVEALTERELEVLHLISQGLTNKQIAQKLVVAPGTIKAHAASIYGKLDVANRTEAVSRARQLGVLP
jgi:LuxR family maltose regulon positive regulatory protein